MSDAKCFVDTNVWVYAKETSDVRKHRASIALIDQLARDRRLAISVQVVTEFHAALKRRLGPERWPEIAAAAEAMLAFAPEPLTGETIRRALQLERRYAVSWRDALILAAAITARCRVLYSEDMQDGAEIDGIQIVNPFTRPA